MNYCAHSAMYTYYTVCALGIRLPKWVRETEGQASQGFRCR